MITLYLQKEKIMSLYLPFIKKPSTALRRRIQQLRCHRLKLTRLILYILLLTAVIYGLRLLTWLPPIVPALKFITNQSPIGSKLQQTLTNTSNENFSSLCTDKNGNAKCIFFTETTERNTLQPLQTCAIESAARHNPNSTIVVLTTANQISENNPLSSVPKKYSNIVYSTVNLREIFRNFQLLDWYTNVLTTRHWKAHISDGLRYIYLYLYGGMYTDLDLINLRSYSSMDTGVCLEHPGVLDDPVVSLFRLYLLPNVGITTGYEHEILPMPHLVRFRNPHHPFLMELIQMINDTESYDSSCYHCTGSHAMAIIIKRHCPWIKSEVGGKCPLKTVVTKEVIGVKKPNVQDAVMQLHSAKQCFAVGAWDYGKLFSTDASDQTHVKSIMKDTPSWSVHYSNSMLGQLFQRTENTELRELFSVDSAFNWIAVRQCPASYAWKPK